MRLHFSLTITGILMVLMAACAPAPAATPTNGPATVPPAPTNAPAATATTAPLAPTSAPAAGYPLTVTDSAGRSVTIAKAQRIISIAPSNTEIIYALGQGARLVAVDDFSDYPAEAKTLPKVGATKLNFEQVVAQNPDLVLASSITSADTLKRLEDLKLTVVVISSQKTTVDTIENDIALTGKVLGVSEQANKLIASMQQRLDALKAKAASAKSKPKVYWELDGTNPSQPFTVGPGGFIDDIITLAGGENVFKNAGSPYPKISAEQVVSANPDVIILSDYAYGVTVESVKGRKGWDVIAAVKNGKIFPIDDNLVSRPGPRVVDGLEAAMKIIHPELF